MRVDSSGAKGTGLLLALALLSNACVPLTPPPGPGRSLRYSPHGATRFAVAGVMAAGPGSSDATVRQSALATHMAFRSALREVSGSSLRVSSELSRLKASGSGIAGAGNGIFVRYVEYGEARLRWIDAELAATTEVAAAASEVEDPEMQLALLRLAGPRLEAAMMGSMLLAVWVDFLTLADAALSRRLDGGVRRVGGDDAPVGARGRPLPARHQRRRADSGRPRDDGTGARRPPEGRARRAG
ncbi:hypothetical protein [Archangium sp. Cb G35]|uniref:hypothetical protein n=1 Tax=Archangium sp. Cb G35 TaxID=1920190 RepID=UPI001E349C7D|nr:hypothetical protein [Archangium sp. Cb G35]